jgi:hypothetical protein
MKITLASLILILVTFQFFSQTRADSISITWAKYLVMNDSNQILLCYDEDYKAWELEGTGYEGPITLKNLLDSIAFYLGFRYNGCKLGGVFTYQKPNRYRVTIKPVFVAHFTGYTNGNSFTNPKRTKWFSLEEAKRIIPYPTMVLIIDQLIRYPNTVWGAAFEEYNYNMPEGTKWKIIEPFYKLN